MRGHYLRGRLLYVCVVGFCVGVAIQTAWPLTVPLFVGIAVAWCALLLLIIAIRDIRIIAVALFIATLLCGAVRTSCVHTALPDEFTSSVGKEISLDGTVVAPPDIRETNDRLTIEIQQGTERTRVIASVPLYPTYVIGEPVHVTGQLILPAPFATDGGRTFAYDKYLAKDGVFALVQKAKVEETNSAPRSGALFVSWRWLNAFNLAIHDALERAIPEPYSSLAVGILIGGKQGLGQDLLNIFTITGLLQIVVLSGYNVTVVTDGILALLGWLPRRLAVTISALGVIAFVCMAGASSSAIRAGCMAVLALFAKATHRTYAVLRILCISLVLMVVWNPLLLLYDPGLELSFAATLGLILGAPLFEKKLLWIKSGWLRDAVATTCAAQICVLPLLLYQSGNLSLVALPANILTMPVVPISMALSAAAALFAFVPNPLASLAGLPAFATLWYIIEVAKLAAKIPFAQVIIPAFPLWIVAIAYALLGFTLWKLHNLPEKPLLNHVPVNVLKKRIDV